MAPPRHTAASNLAFQGEKAGDQGCWLPLRTGHVPALSLDSAPSSLKWEGDFPALLTGSSKYVEKLWNLFFKREGEVDVVIKNKTTK